MEISDLNFKPFLRWAGGKRWLARKIGLIIQQRLTDKKNYFEPFLGSGAVFFETRPRNAILTDLNEELIITFNQLKNKSYQLTQTLLEIPSSKEKYYQVRAWNPSNEFQKAVRFIYLNSNCFGGIYRENLKGEFNVPFGGGDRSHFGICNNGTLLASSIALNESNTHLNCCDFEESIFKAQSGDIVYCDPTYNSGSRRVFNRYGKVKFDWNDHIRLKEACSSAFERGSLVLLSNSNSPEVINLYKDFQIINVFRNKGLGLKSSKKNQSEVLIIMDPKGNQKLWANLFKSNKNHQR